MAPKLLVRSTPLILLLLMPKVVSLLLRVRLATNGPVTVAVAPPVLMLAPAPTLITVVPPKVVVSVPPAAGLVRLQVTVGLLMPVQAASALSGWPAITAMNAPVKAVLASHARRRRGLNPPATSNDPPKPGATK